MPNSGLASLLTVEGRHVFLLTSSEKTIMNLTFAHRKATQALNYFACQDSGRISKMKALKLVYFADRYHLRTYGRPITNDRYIAMKYGPVASSCKDLAEMSEFLGAEERTYSERFLAPSGHEYESKAAVDSVELSETDLEALIFVWREYGSKDGFELAVETHKFPEWKRHEDRLASPYESRVSMRYTDFLENAPQGVDPLPPLSPEQQSDLREQLEELHSIESIWR